MREGGKGVEGSSSSSFAVQPDSTGSLCVPLASPSPSNVSDCTAVPEGSVSDPYTPCSPLHGGGLAEGTSGRLAEVTAAPEKLLQQTEIIVEEEPALVHTRHALRSATDGREHSSTVCVWSPVTPELVELIPIGTTPSQRDSVVTHETEASPHSPCESQRGSPRPPAFSSAARLSATPGESASHVALEKGVLSLLSSTCTNSPRPESAQDTPSSSSPWRHGGRGRDEGGDAPKALFAAGDRDRGTPQSPSTELLPPPSNFHRCATAAPARLPAAPCEPHHSPLPAAAQPRKAQVPGTPSLPSVCAAAKGKDAGSPAPSAAPLSLHASDATRTNASGGAVPTVPAIRLPDAHASCGMDSDRGVGVMGYGPRSAPNACSLTSARSSRSSRSARHSHRGGTSFRTTLPSLRELFPTLPDEMYLSRERLCVAQDNVGRLGTGAYGTVQLAELYPPEVEVPRFFTPVADTCTTPSVPNTPRYSPASGLLPAHNFASIASVTGGAEGGAAAILAGGAPGRDPYSVFLHSRLDSAVSTDSASVLPIHQQPYSDQTASFYNGLDEVPCVTSGESISDAHWPGRGQSPEVESVLLCGAIAVNTDSGETSAPTTLSTKGQPGMLGSHRSLSALQDMPQQPLHDRQGPTSTPTSTTSRCFSQLFPDLPVVLVGKVKGGEVSGFSLDSPQTSIAHIVAGELDLDTGDNVVRMSTGDDELKRVLSGPLQDTMATAEDADEVSLASTAGTRQFTSAASERWDNKTCLFSSRTTRSNVHDGREEEEEDYSTRCEGNSTTLPTRTVDLGDGDAEKPFYLYATRRVTKQQQQPSEVSLEAHQSEVPALLHVDPVADAVRRTTNVYNEKALCLPLVLPRGQGANGCSASYHTSESTADGTGSRGAGAAVVAEEAEKVAAVMPPTAAVVEGRQESTDDNEDETRGCEERRLSSLFLADGRDLSFLASVTFPELQESRQRVGDDTLTSTAQQAVAQAVREACEEYEDACAKRHGAEQRAGTDERAGTAVTVTMGEAGENAVAAGDVHCEESMEDGGAAAATRGTTWSTHLRHSSTVSATSAGTTGDFHTGGAGATTAAITGGAGKRVEQVSPTSTVSSLFSGGVTNVTTTRTSKQGSVGAAPRTSTNPLQTSNNTPETPLMCYGVNSAMILAAVSNGCAPFRPVAVKVVEKSDLAGNALKLNAFHNELRMASRLNHPCLVNVFGVAEDAENFYLVMDMAEKGNLTQYQKDFGVADTRTMAPRFLADVVLALEYLRDGLQHTYWMTAKEAATPANATGEDHAVTGGARESRFHATHQRASPATTPDASALSASATALHPCAVEDPLSSRVEAASERDQLQLLQESMVLHRDVKPDNLLLTWDFHVKLADFGDACFYGDEEANCFGGTPSYLSPEVIQSSKAGPCSDLWAMGCILYELLVGEKLFTGSLRDVANRIQAFDSADLVFPSSSSDAVDDFTCEADECAGNDNMASGGGIITEAAKDLVRQLLRRVPEERIGSAERGGFATLKQHPFFSEIAWDAVLETTNMTTTNTDYTAELADYLGAGESVVYCSPVKVLPSGEPHARTRSTHLSAQGSLVMVLTDSPRLFLVNPDTDTVQFYLPWSPELRVGVLRADRFTVTLPISDVLPSPSTPAAAFNGGASLGTVSRASTSAGSTITYTFLDINRRADLWGVQIHHLQSRCPTRREWDRSTPTFPSRQSSSTQPSSSTNGVPPLHWPQQTRRGTPTLSPRAGACLLHRLRTTPRSARAGSVSGHAVSFTDAATTTTPLDGRNRLASNARSFSEVSGDGALGASTASAASRPKPVTRYAQPIRLPVTSLLASSAPSSGLCAAAAPGKAAVTLTSPAGMSSGRSSTELRSPEGIATVGTAPLSVHRRVNTMTVTIASSSNPQPVQRGCWCAPGHPGTSSADFDTTGADRWAEATVEAATADVSLASAAGTSDAGGSLCDDVLGFSGSIGVVTPRVLRDDAARLLARDTRSQSEATPGPSSAQRNVDAEAEMGGSFHSLGSVRFDSEGDGGRTSYTPLRSASLSNTTGTTAVPSLKEKMSKARQHFQLTLRRKTQV